jgi:hypothetical protein
MSDLFKFLSLTSFLLSVKFLLQSLFEFNFDLISYMILFAISFFYLFIAEGSIFIALIWSFFFTTLYQILQILLINNSTSLILLIFLIFLLAGVFIIYFLHHNDFKYLLSFALFIFFAGLIIYFRDKQIVFYLGRISEITVNYWNLYLIFIGLLGLKLDNKKN